VNTEIDTPLGRYTIRKSGRIKKERNDAGAITLGLHPAAKR